MEENWYKTSDTHTADWYSAVKAEEAARPAPPVKKRRSFKWPLIILTLALLLGATGYALTHEGLPTLSALWGKETSKETEAPGQNAGFSYSWGFGDSEDEDAESGLPNFPGNFEDFFKNYYTAFEAAEECTIPRVEARKDLSLQLETTHGEELSLQELYRQCNPFIVAISAYADEKSGSYAYGTGVLFTADGYIVTNSHIVEGSCKATVILWDDREYEAALVGNDARSDIAVLKIEGINLPCCTFATSDGLAVGDVCIAIGNPLGSTFRSTMTNGIITGIDRDINYNGATLTLIQTNAALNEGNSGGALLNRYGQVIGITNMKMSNRYSGVTIEGVGFAIPSATVKTMADSLLQNGKVMGRPALGITVGAIPETAAEEYALPEGLYVSDVNERSDCAAQGLQVGDVITHVNGQPVSVTADVVDLVATMQVGDTLQFTVFRSDRQGGGETMEMTVKLIDTSEVY